MAPLYARYVPPKPVAEAPALKKLPKEISVQDSPLRTQDKHGKKRKRTQVNAHVADTAAPPRRKDAEDESKKHTGVLSKFQKAAVRSEAAKAAGLDQPQEPQELPELHDLTPLPQPQRAPTPEFVPSFSALPDWLAHPTVVSQSTTKPFSELALSQKTLAHLESKGYTTAFAVQTALLPLLLPHPYLTHLPPNDICVSAPTGSGKTLAYVLPIVENLRNRMNTKLRAVIVVPTRELVAQAHAVASTCASGSSIQIAVAVGNQSIASEQEALVKKGRKYDPERYRSLMAKAKKRIRFESDSDSQDTDSTLLDDLVRLPTDYVPTYSSAADLLICTPGRLVEHMATTTGFNLHDVEWLVVDEADRLLDQSFQEWVSKVTTALEVQKPSEIDLVGNTVVRQLLRRRDRYVRKIILSATMTRDVSKLSALRLRRPTMVVVKTEAQSVREAQPNAIDGSGGFELPRTLKEFAVPVGDGSDKPLYLLELLRTKILPSKLHNQTSTQDDSDGTSSSSSDDSSSSDEDSDSSDESSSSEDEDDSAESSSDDSGSDADTSSDSESESDSDASSTAIKSNPASGFTSSSSTTTGTMVLIFTPSTEAAARLHHLVTHISPAYKPITTLLTKASKNPASLRPIMTKSLKGDLSSPSRIIISTDRASRGLDLPQLTHVINYSVPRSLPSYVHRVGRTARAGRSGEAWTLFAENEGRWFWNEVARAKDVGRVSKVERLNMKLASDQVEGGDMRERYEKELESIKDIVVNKSRGKRGKGGADEDVEMAD